MLRPALAQTPAQTASAQLMSSSGQSVGTANFTASGQAVVLSVQVRGLPPGPHGIHIHAVGRCDGPAFTSAGAHFNPAGRTHGLNNAQGPHAGDLPTLLLAADGSGSLTTTNALISLADGVANSLFDADGSALVIHAANDDQMTDPTGNSGDRIACGVITRAAAAVATPTSAPATQAAGAAAGLTPPRTGNGGLGAGPQAEVTALLLALALLTVAGGRALTGLARR